MLNIGVGRGCMRLIPFYRCSTETLRVQALVITLLTGLVHCRTGHRSREPRGRCDRPLQLLGCDEDISVLADFSTNNYIISFCRTFPLTSLVPTPPGCCNCSVVPSDLDLVSLV